MGTQENIDYIKQELSNEEKFLESLIKAEKFYKKYKKHFVILGIAVLVGVGGYVGYEMKIEHDLRVSNEAYEKLLQKRGTKEDLQLLQSKNPKLYTLYLYQEALQNKDEKALQQLAGSDDPVISDLARYHIAVLRGDEPKLSTYASQENIYTDLAKLDDAYLLYRQEKIESAHAKLATIQKTSPVAPYALLLRHYGVTK